MPAPRKSHAFAARLWPLPSPELRLRREAASLTGALFTTPLPRSEAAARIRAHPGLSEDLRQRALTNTHDYPEAAEPSLYYRAALDLLRRPRLPSRFYETARTQLGHAA